MNNQQHKPSPGSNRDFLLKYAGLGTQLLAAIGLSVFAGLKIDKWLHTSPLFACALPLLVLAAIFYKLYKETTRKNSNEEKNRF